MQEGPHKISLEQHKKELEKRTPPIVNVGIIIKKENNYLMGTHPEAAGYRLFPGGRMKYNESPQETALRLLNEEVPGVNATIKKILTVEADKGWDPRCYGITIYFLLTYVSGNPLKNERILDLRWVPSEEFATANNIYLIDQKLARQIDIEARSINSSTDELLVEVDEDNKEIGTLTKRDAHTNKSRFHRAAHVMIFTTHGEVVLQQRGLHKDVAPGMWDMPGGHQSAGQTIEQCAQAELMEELGVATPLKLHRIGLYKGLEQSEFYHLYSGISDGPYGFDKNEVQQVSVFDCKKLLESRPKEVLPHVFEYIRELKSVWEPLQKANGVTK